MTDRYTMTGEELFTFPWQNPEFMADLCDMAEEQGLTPDELTKDLMFFAITAYLSPYVHEGATSGVLKMVASKLAFEFAELLATALLLTDPSVDGIDDPKNTLN
jgi:hypothetical protein